MCVCAITAQLPGKECFRRLGPVKQLRLSFLLKTAKLVLFHWTYCFAPTRPLVSGGLLPGNKASESHSDTVENETCGLGAERTEIREEVCR